MTPVDPVAGPSPEGRDGPEPDRDRNEWGRPENARPRDRTGRPLPYDTDETELAQEHPVATVEDALEVGRRLWDEQRYFEAHELLEHVWHEAPPQDRAFWQGVIQVAVALVHHQRGREPGVGLSMRKALDNLDGYPPDHHGIDVAALRDLANGVLDGDPGAVGPMLPRLPVTDGPWFTREGGPHVLPEDPSWMVAARRRQQRAT